MTEPTDLDVVHVFGCLGRFTSDADLDAYLDPAYDEDGDIAPSLFMDEIGLDDDYEPMAIERVVPGMGQDGRRTPVLLRR